jgi:hypothetical protein
MAAVKAARRARASAERRTSMLAASGEWVDWRRRRFVGVVCRVRNDIW